MDIKDFIKVATSTHNTEYLHNYSIDVDILQNNPMACNIFERFLCMDKESDNPIIKQLLLNTLIDNGIIKPARAIAIDAILKDIENEQQ